MHEKFEGVFVVLMYTLAAISGGLGGCAVTAHAFISGGERHRGNMRLSWLLAYSIIGSVFGLLTAIYGVAFLEIERYTDIIGPSLIAGIVGASSLSFVNMTSRIVLKRLGVEVIVTVKRNEQENRA